MRKTGLYRCGKGDGIPSGEYPVETRDVSRPRTLAQSLCCGRASMGKKSVTGGVTAAGRHRIRFDFSFEGRAGSAHPHCRLPLRQTSGAHAGGLLSSRSGSPPERSFSLTSSRTFAISGLCRAPARRGHAARYSMLFWPTANPAWPKTTWRRSRSQPIAAFSTDFGDRGSGVCPSSRCAIRCSCESRTRHLGARRPTTRRSACYGVRSSLDTEITPSDMTP